MYITDRNRSERADLSEFYVANPNDDLERRTFLWLLPPALLLLGLLVFSVLVGAISASSLLVVLGLGLTAWASLGNKQ